MLVTGPSEAADRAGRAQGAWTGVLLWLETGHKLVHPPHPHHGTAFSSDALGGGRRGLSTQSSLSPQAAEIARTADVCNTKHHQTQDSNPLGDHMVLVVSQCLPERPSIPKALAGGVLVLARGEVGVVRQKSPCSSIPLGRIQ